MPYLTNCAAVYPCTLSGAQSELYPIPGGTVAWHDEKIGWVGPEKDLPESWRKESAIDCGGGIAIPGLIDCHTHLAFGGWRADEFVERLQGKTYLEIAARGGGILSTVAKTRAASAADLLSRCQEFLRQMTMLGVTTVECKSGYGLALEAEVKLLKVYAELARTSPVTIVSTFLGAHTIPRELREERGRYLREIIGQMLPEVAKQGLAAFCDVFVEKTAFSIEEARQILVAAQSLGLKSKLHADQLTAGGGAELAAELHATSADHLEYASDAGVAAMAEANVVAVMLPMASLYTKERGTDARRFINAGVKVAVATDFNPGSAPSYHLPFALSLGCLLNGLTPAEALKGATSIAAQALGLEHSNGALEVGKFCDIAVLDAPSVEQWLYHLQGNCCRMTIKAGRQIYSGAKA